MAFEETNYDIQIEESQITASYAGEQVRLTTIAPGVIRVQATRNPEFIGRPWALLATEPIDTSVESGETGARMRTEDTEVYLSREGVLSFTDVSRGVDLLREPITDRPYQRKGREYAPKSSDLWRIEVTFEGAQERIYGLGQHQDNVFDRKGSVVELFQKNTEVAIPFYYSTRGYGFFWNNPAIGRVTFGTNGTRWEAESSREIDYCVFASATPAEALRIYTEITGRTPEMPEYAMGFWQSRLRYEKQTEAIEVFREHRRRDLPLDVLVIDYFHSPHMGDWRFDEAYWPDPESMIGEMVADGTEVMVSVWPTVNPESENYSEMHRRGFLADTEYGPKPLMEFTDADTEGTKTLYYYDPFNPEARQFVWSKVKQNYFDKGVKIFWLDACEPEAYPYDPGNVRYHAGRGDEVGCAYPFVHQKGFYEGMKRAGLDNPINLCRSAWAGSQRFGAAVWSGDIDATFDALRTQVTAGLQMAMSGIPWWTTDIGGFFANPTDDPKFRELLIRWFQYGAFCPIFRLHGFRDSDDFKRGGDNEVWSFGEKVYAIAGNLLHLREALKPYMRKQMKEAARSGVPPMRPLFFDYASDKAAYEVADQFLFGPDIMIAPILEYRARSREVYIPEGSQFLDVRTGQEVPGGERITANAEIESIPVYAREGSEALKILRDFL